MERWLLPALLATRLEKQIQRLEVQNSVNFTSRQKGGWISRLVKSSAFSIRCANGRKNPSDEFNQFWQKGSIE